MADVVVIDVDEFSPEVNKKSLKRKRAPSVVTSLSTEERGARIGALREELEGLFKYYKDVLEDKKVTLNTKECRTPNMVIACLLEESSLPLSKLVDQIFEKMNHLEGSGSFSLASIKSSVLLIGQRLCYGVPNADADLLEDDDVSCLWCWEARDLKMLPKSARGALKVWRTCRKKIHERISAVSVMIRVLQKSEKDKNCKQELNKASEKLAKVLSETEIRILVEALLQKIGADVAEKELHQASKYLVKELEKNHREVENKKNKMDHELQMEKIHSEKEVKRLQDEAEKREKQREKEVKRLQDEAEKREKQREKEESEMKKQLKKQQEDAEKEQRRREKEEVASKKQLALQKQASLMERFLKKSKNKSASQSSKNLRTSPDFSSSSSSSSPHVKENLQLSKTFSMDSALSHKDEFKEEDMWKSHVISWHNLGRSNRRMHWGIRQKPKTELVKELKLITTKEIGHDDELNLEKVVNGWSETKTDAKNSSTKDDDSLCSDRKINYKQLLQFDKSNRPAFYGIWPKKSIVVRARCPLVKDPDLDYEIDSDEEWEEEEPGESLSDCEKDEEECFDEGQIKADDEDESEDSFFVPDGYLSENEGVQVDRMDCDEKIILEASSKQDVECEEELSTFFKQQKTLNNLTEHALRKNRPLIITNFSKDKNAPLLSDKSLIDTCLQALSIRAFPGGGTSVIDASVVSNDSEPDILEASPSQSKGSNTAPVLNPMAILDSDMPQIVSIIQLNSQGISKVVEALHNQFPAISKTHLRNKVREISEFVDNHWQVKKEILQKLGLPTTPDKGSWTKKKSIASFFSKRCLPPSAVKTGNHPIEISPQKPCVSSTPETIKTTAEQ